MKKKNQKRIKHYFPGAKPTALVLMLALLLGALSGCTSTIDNPGNTNKPGTNKPSIVDSSMNLMEGITVSHNISEAERTKLLGQQDITASLSDFGINILNESIKEADGENLLVSPISILYAMAMCVNGAEGATRDEILSALASGLGGSPEEALDKLNQYLAAYLDAIEEYTGDPERPADLHIANSIWLKNDEKFHPEQNFLETNGMYYNAGLFKSDFDEAAVKTVNGWIEDNTKGLIKDMLSGLSQDTVMLLINALGFEAEWSEIYDDYALTKDAIFHGKSGDTQVTLMHSSEYEYLDDGRATGFIKYYAGWDYAFVALLPKEGTTPEEYLSGLTGDQLYDMLSNPSQEKVITALPKFKSDSTLSLVEAFKAMGVTEAFRVDGADFSALGSYDGRNIFIGDILHSTFVNVDQLGTKAGAATVVSMLAGSAMLEEPPKEVILDRPFVYMIIDANQSLPLFIGVQNDVTAE